MPFPWKTGASSLALSDAPSPRVLAAVARDPIAARFLVISFQRSGLNWLRYCTESFTGIRTPGRKQLIADGPVFFDRAHDVRRGTTRSDYAGLRDTSGTEIYERVALLVRHPFDCFTSHYFERRGFDFKRGSKHFGAYAVNINEFDRLTGAKKASFYFEDFINNDSATLAFLRFFDIDVDARPRNFSEMKEASRSWYRGHHGLFGEGERPASKAKERAAIRAMLQRRLGESFARYLGRYSLDE
jgi:hypothetical protein